MFKCNYRTLSLEFDAFHDVKAGDMPRYGDYVLLELKDGRHTAGEWHPNDDEGKTVSGNFIRSSFDSVDVSEVAKWHHLERYDLSECLEDEHIGSINFAPSTEDTYTVKIGDFKSFKDGDFPKKEQYCLLIFNDGTLGAGRWDELGENDGMFIYQSALAAHNMQKVWAWTPLSSDEIFEREEEKERERLAEEEMNRNPSANPEKFRYGTDIEAYYEKALEKLREEYPWATLAQMKKKTPLYVIVPRHGQYIFGQDRGSFMGRPVVWEWKDGNTADDFINFLCEYTRENVKNSDPNVKFAYGTDIETYIRMTYEKVKKDYNWFSREMADKYCQYAIIEVDGELEFVRKFRDDKEFHVYDCGTAENLLKNMEHEYQEAALKENSVVAEYAVPFGRVDANGWGLEKYIVYKLKSGDYKVYVQAGDRTTGGSREFFITPDCFEAKTYGEFLDRYLEIVPGSSFGLKKKDLAPNKELKKFFGY
ncbi:MAG: hypothetical protein IKP88_15375 [Lachnospiraceae bacterium]|nr:hypothetical protein [Lachnospiraceae bacterium]